MGPPNVLLAPNPTSSVKIKRTFGAPFGASTLFGKSGVESFTVRPILPWNGGSGFGSTLSWAKAQVTGALQRMSANRETSVVSLMELLIFSAHFIAVSSQAVRGKVTKFQCNENRTNDKLNFKFQAIGLWSNTKAHVFFRPNADIASTEMERR